MKKPRKKTTFELAAYAKEKFGVDLDPSHPRTELVKEIRRLESKPDKKQDKSPDTKEKRAEVSGDKKPEKSATKKEAKGDKKQDKSPDK